jgi:hypothetical protein
MGGVRGTSVGRRPRLALARTWGRRPCGWLTRTPPPVHSSGAPLKDDIGVGPVMPEDERGGVFNADGLPQEVAHLGRGQAELEAGPVLAGRDTARGA